MRDIFRNILEVVYIVTGIFMQLSIIFLVGLMLAGA